MPGMGLDATGQGVPWTFARAVGPIGCPALDVGPSGAGPSVLGCRAWKPGRGVLCPLTYRGDGPGTVAALPVGTLAGCRAVWIPLSGRLSFGPLGGAGIGLSFVGLPPIDSTNFRNRSTMRVQGFQFVGKTGGSPAHPPGFTDKSTMG